MIPGERASGCPGNLSSPWLSFASDGKNYNAVGKFYHFKLTPRPVRLSPRSMTTLSDSGNHLIF